MFSPTHAFLSAAAMEMASKKATTRNNSTFATNRESDSTKSPPGHSRGRSLADCGFNVDYDTKEVERLAQEIRDGTVAETLLELFVHWICKHEKNYDEARKYIRELNLDQNYDVSRITNESVRKVVNDSFDLRPKYNAPIPEEREGTVDLLEVLRESAIESASIESAIKPNTPKNKLRSITSSRASLQLSFRKTSEFFRPRSSGIKQESPLKRSEDDWLMFEGHLTSPISSPLTPREASPMVGSFPKLKKSSIAASIGTSAVVTAPRSRSQQYPPDTPDRPAPLTVKPKTTSAQKSQTACSASTPTRTRWVAPLSPDGESPPPAVPAVPSLSRYASSSKSKTKYSLIPAQYAQRPVNGGLFTSKEDDSATCIDSFITAASRSPDGAATVVTNPFTNSAASSVYSDTHEAKRFSTFEGHGGAEYRYDSPSVENEIMSILRYASESDNTEDDWYTIEEEVSEVEVAVRPTSLYDSNGFFNEAPDTQEEGDLVSPIIESFPDIPAQPSPPSPLSPNPSRVDSLPKMSKIPRLRKVTPEQRAAAKQASKEARDATLAAMGGFDRPLPLRRLQSTHDRGMSRAPPPPPPAPAPAPAPFVFAGEEEDEEDEVAAEEGERLILSLC